MYRVYLVVVLDWLARKFFGWPMLFPSDTELTTILRLKKLITTITLLIILG